MTGSHFFLVALHTKMVTTIVYEKYKIRQKDLSVEKSCKHHYVKILMATVFLLANTCSSVSLCVSFPCRLSPLCIFFNCNSSFGSCLSVPAKPGSHPVPPTPPRPRPTPSQRYPLTHFGLKRPFARHEKVQ